jgi:pimeloyl-ACP methyl ester carboxylesterase
MFAERIRFLNESTTIMRAATFEEVRMGDLYLGKQDALYYEYAAPRADNRHTFVFFNALTGDTNTWETVIGPRLRALGHGTLTYNMRGQTDSPFSPDLELNTDLIVDDAVRLLNEVMPPRSILVGLSIGGLFAARAWLKGANANGLVLINTLRRDGPRLQWIGDALVRAVEVGGLALFKDLFLPLLVNEKWLAASRTNFLKPDPAYKPIDPKSGAYKLLAEAGRTADWDLPYENLDLPTLVISGLQDHVFLDRDDVERLFSRLPRAQRIDMRTAGHLIPAEHPEALAEALLTFAKAL